MVFGWYISFKTPGTLGTGICIANGILSKSLLLNQLGVDYDWPCYGFPQSIHVDNAKEFRGNTLSLACNNYGIDLQFRKVKKPRYGAHIERLLGTLSNYIHTLPGTTFSNSKQREGYDSAEKAVMTLTEFEKWLAHVILGKYHHEFHSGIGMPPIEKYRKGILGDDQAPGIGIIPMPLDPERLRIDFLPYIERTIQPAGVLIDYIQYYSDALQPWIGARNDVTGRQKRKFLFRRDPRDISFLWFFDPQVKAYFRIPYRNPSLPAITLWELKAAQKHLEHQGKKAVDENVIFHALEEMERIEETASLTTKELKKKQAKKNKRKPPVSITASPPQATPAPAPAPSPSTLGNDDLPDVAPFEEIERL